MLKAIVRAAAAGAMLSTFFVPASPAETVSAHFRILTATGRDAGFEKYELRKEASLWHFDAQTEFSDRGTAMPLEVRLVTAPDATPISFRASGKPERFTSTKQSIEMDGSTAQMRDEATGTSSSETLGKLYFPRIAFRPASLNMLLIRYWREHGRPSRITVLPAGSVSISQAGRDSVRSTGGVLVLDRFQLRSDARPAETIWLDAHGLLAAAVVNSPGAISPNVIRDDLAAELPFFLRKRNEATVAEIERISNTVRPLASGRIALVGGRLIDVKTGAATEGSVVLIDRGRIRYAGARRKVPRGFRRVDVSGKTLLPGLWDMHAHFGTAMWAPLYLAMGVTTVRDVANQLEFAIEVRAAIEMQRVKGPRMLLAGIIDADVPRGAGSVLVSTPEQARAAVQRYRAAGYDQIKVYGSITTELLASIVDESHKLGLSVTGHVPTTMSTAQALALGLDQINHTSLILRGLVRSEIENGKPFLEAVADIDVNGPAANEILAELKRRRVVVDPTLGLVRLLNRSLTEPLENFDAEIARLPPLIRQELARTGVAHEQEAVAARAMATARAFSRRMHEEGVTLVAGTDIGVPGLALCQELEEYTALGMTPLEALRTATTTPAEVMGRKDLGRVAEGALADLIVIDGDPLADIRRLRHVDLVMSRGVLYDTDDFWRAAGFQPRKSR